jgi:hypothetical protein
VITEHPTVRGLARLLPGIVAGALALIYVIGSVNAAGAFARDGIPVSAVRLLSLEQILVRGVSVLTQPTLLVGGVVMALVIMVLNRLSDRVKERISSGRSRPSAAVRSLSAILAVACVIALLFFPWVLAAAFGVSLLGIAIITLALWDDDSAERRRRQRLRFVLMTEAHLRYRESELPPSPLSLMF